MPKLLISVSIDIFLLSTSIPKSLFSLAATSFEVTEPKSFPFAPAFAVSLTVFPSIFEASILAALISSAL